MSGFRPSSPTQHGVNTPCSSITSSPPTNPVFCLKETASLPTFHGTCNASTIKTLYDFVTTLERTFKLRNYELQLRADSTDGWVNYAMMQLRGAAEDRAVFDLGASPNIPWKTFKKWLIDGFALDKWVQELHSKYSTFDCMTLQSSGDITIFNNKFREYKLLLSFVGRDTSQEDMIKEYETRVMKHKKVAVALKQLTTTEKIVERLESLKLEEIMNYCENVHHTG